MRCGVRVRCRRDLGEIRARCRRGEIAGELANEIQTRSRRDSPAALPLRRGAGGESTGSANPKSTSGAGSSGGSRTATGARQRSAGEKKRGGVSLAPSEPHAPTLRHSPATPLADVCDLWGGARRSRPCGWGRRRPRAPPRAAPTRRPSSAIRTTAVGRAESVMSVAQWWGQ